MTRLSGRRWLCAALVTMSATSLSQASAEQGYRPYRNARFGVSADVPADWKADPKPANGDGLVLSSPDGASTITVSGILNVDGAPAAEMIRDQQRVGQGENVTYQKAAARQVVVSGLRGDLIFYRKVILSCNDQIVNRLAIEYPATQKQAFDALVSHVAGSMRSSPGAQIPDCK
jgi:hypothetical protein